MSPAYLRNIRKTLFSLEKDFAEPPVGRGGDIRGGGTRACGAANGRAFAGTLAQVSAVEQEICAIIEEPAVIRRKCVVSGKIHLIHYRNFGLVSDKADFSTASDIGHSFWQRSITLGM